MAEGKAKEGWYPHPSVPGTKRWWDGEKWTDHVRPPAAEADPELLEKLNAISRHLRSLSVSIGIFVFLSIVGGVIAGIAVGSAASHTANQIQKSYDETCQDVGTC